MKSVQKVKTNLLIQLNKTLGRTSRTQRGKDESLFIKQKTSRNPLTISASNLRKVYRSVQPSKRQQNYHKQDFNSTKTKDFSSFLRTKQYDKRYYNQEREQQKENKCQIILHQNGSKRKFYYQVQKVKGLIQFLREKQKNDSVITYCTIPTNLAHDFYLTKQDHDGSFFNKKTLHLKPYHKTNKPKIDIKSFQIIKCIGSGGFSKVYLAKFKEDGKFYAMKLIQKQFILQHKKQEIVLNQRNVMVEMDHPFIIPLKFAFQSPDYVVFILQYCPGGELFTYVKKYRKMTQSVAKFFIIEVLTGIDYLHQKNVIYRDIKPENILLDLEGHVRIADLGLAKPLISKEDKAYSFCGSPEYMPPEMILKVGHGRPVDYYCVGALLYQLLTGLPPFYNKNVDTIYEAVLTQQLTFPKHTQLSTDCKKLLKALLEKQPKRRLGSISGVKQILAHPWFGRIDKRQVINKELSPPIQIDNEDNLQLDANRQQDETSLLKVQRQQKLNNVFTKIMGDNFYYDSRKSDFELPLSTQKIQKSNENNIYLKQNNFFMKSVGSTERRCKSPRINTSGQMSSRKYKDSSNIKQNYGLKSIQNKKQFKQIDTNRLSVRKLKKNATMKTYFPFKS